MRKTPRISIFLLFLSLAAVVAQGQSGAAGTLRLEVTIPLPDVQGRIDHLAVDVQARRLFMAALSNNSLEVIDLKANRRIYTMRGLSEPQGIAYVPSVNRVYVANGKDGSVRVIDATTWRLLKSVPYGDDADNLRIDPGTGHIWVGFGDGGLGEFDQEGGKLGNIQLDAHPESFQFEKGGHRIFVNLPDSKKIAVVDRKNRSIAASWSTGGPLANFPMALDEQHHRLFVVTRSPARLVVLDADGGNRIASLPAIGDCDDVFYDERRHRLYAIGGEGGISVFDQKDANHYNEIGRVGTVTGARTGFFSADLDRLYVAVRKHESQPAEIRVYVPLP